MSGRLKDGGRRELRGALEDEIASQDLAANVSLLGLRDDVRQLMQAADIISNERVEKVSDKLSEGDLVKVKVLEVDRQGRVRLSMKEVEAA